AGNMTGMEHDYRESMVIADRSGLIREMFAARWMLAHALALGPLPVPECMERCDEIVTFQGMEIPGGLMTLGLLNAMTGRFDRAREVSDRAHRIVEEQVGARRMLKFVWPYRGLIEQLAGDLAAAERSFRTALEIDFSIER